MVKLKIVLLTIISVVGLSASKSYQSDWQWVNLGDRESPSNAIQVIPELSGSGISFDVRVDGFYRQSVSVEGSKYDRIYIPGGSRSAEIGKPEIPAIGRWFAVPHGAEVFVSWNVIKADTLKNIYTVSGPASTGG